MTKPKLIETLEDLATFFTLSRSDAEAQGRTARGKRSLKRAAFCSGREAAYGVAFLKLNGILKEAKK